MTVGVIVKLFHGVDELDLNSGRYCIEDSTFSPPTAARAVTFSRLSAGSEAVRKRRTNRNWTFNINIVTSSKSEAERALRELQSFLNRSALSTEPLYVAYRSYNDYTYEPYFGLQGAFMRYEIEHGHAEAGGQYNPTVGNSNAIINVTMSLTIRPQAVALPQRAGQATGGIFESYIGRVDGSVKGTVIGEATTNLVQNPVFMNNTYNTNWSTAGTAGLVAAANFDPKYLLFGDTSVKLTYSATATDARYVANVTATDEGNYVASVYVKAHDGSAITSSEVQLWYGAAASQVTPSVYISQGDGWYRLVADVTGVIAATAFGVNILDNSQPYYVDGFQFEDKASLEVTPMCYGSLIGCAWASTFEDSNSTRTLARLRYKFADVLSGRVGYTIRVAWLPEVASSSASRYIFEDSNDDIGAWIDTSDQVNFQVDTGAIATSSPLTITPGTPIVAYFTFDGTTATAYWANASASSIASVATQADSANTAEPSLVYIGTDDTPANSLNGTIMGFATFSRAMSSADVSADFAQVRQQIIDHERIDPLPWLFTEGGDDIIDNETDQSSLYSYGMVGGLMGDDVDYELKVISSTVFSTTGGVTLGSVPVQQRYFNNRVFRIAAVPTGFSFIYDGQGTGDTAANNNVYEAETVDGTEGTIAFALGDAIGRQHTLEAEDVYATIVLKESSNGDQLNLRLVAQHGGDVGKEYIGSPWRTVASDTAAYRPYTIGPVPSNLGPLIADAKRQLFGIRVQAKRGTGGTNGPVRVSHAIFHPALTNVYLGDVSSDHEVIYLRGRISELADSATTEATTEATRQMGGELVFKQNRINILLAQNAFDNYTGTTTSWSPSYTLDFDIMQFTPRFDIL